MELFSHRVSMKRLRNTQSGMGCVYVFLPWCKLRLNVNGPGLQSQLVLWPSTLTSPVLLILTFHLTTILTLPATLKLSLPHNSAQMNPFCNYSLTLLVTIRADVRLVTLQLETNHAGEPSTYP